jgi:hypothetical protein
VPQLAKYSVKHIADSTRSYIVSATEREHRETGIHPLEQIVHVAGFGGGAVALADREEEDDASIKYRASAL